MGWTTSAFHEVVHYFIGSEEEKYTIKCQVRESIMALEQAQGTWSGPDAMESLSNSSTGVEKHLPASPKQWLMMICGWCISIRWSWFMTNPLALVKEPWALPVWCGPEISGGTDDHWAQKRFNTIMDNYQLLTPVGAAHNHAHWTLREIWDVQRPRATWLSKIEEETPSAMVMAVI